MAWPQRKRRPCRRTKRVKEGCPATTLEQLDEDKKKTLYDLIDTYIRDAKARKAYAQKVKPGKRRVLFIYVFI